MKNIKKIKVKSIHLEAIRRVSLEKFKYQLIIPQELQSGEISLFKFGYPIKNMEENKKVLKKNK